ncbi:MAG: AtpZ/AtpI family protein [Alphaproteobacteria bacterium]|nr:AtpZ/AtpI family protein [Alphaproteobacteria bacterium]
MTSKPDDIQQIEKRIQKLKTTNGKRAEESQEKQFIYAYQVGSRIAAELVSGVLVGAGLGYLLDKLCNTAPLQLIIFLILGGIAGFLNVYRFVKNQDRKEK